MLPVLCLFGIRPKHQESISPTQKWKRSKKAQVFKRIFVVNLNGV